MDLDNDLIKHIRAIARKLSHDPQNYEDYAQEALLHLLERLNRWEPTGTFRAWASIVAANKIRDCLRKERRYRARLNGSVGETPPQRVMDRFYGYKRSE